MLFLKYLYRLFLCGILMLSTAYGQATKPVATKIAEGAVILQYHRFGEAQYPSTNVRMPQFESHIRYLQEHDFKVWALPRIIEYLQAGRAFPPKIVGLSIDDAYLSVYREAWPLLRSANFPVTIFVVPQSHAHNSQSHAYMNWQQLREMAASGLVTIGSQTVSHSHLPLLGDADIARELQESAKLIEKHSGVRPVLLAYPYGEANLTAMRLAQEAGYSAAFGQHSGVIGANSELYYLPRFAVNETYANISDLAIKINSLPLPVVDFHPTDPVLNSSQREYGFALAQPLADSHRITCYHSHQQIQLQQTNELRFNYQLQKNPPLGRSRINCTLPSRDGRWMWYGRQFVRY